MKRAGWRGVFAAFCALALGLCWAMPVFAAEPEEPEDVPGIGTQAIDTVENEDELRLWCEGHAGTGGTVHLANSITISQGFYVNNSALITIDTGAFGLFIDGGAANPGITSLAVTGEGVGTPVLTWNNTSEVPPYMGNWNVAMLGVSVTATGNAAGEGGIAVHVLQDDGAGFNMGDVGLAPAVIRAYGVGAVGLLLDAPVDVYCMDIAVEGENSVAVCAPSGANLYYCRLAAPDTGAAVSGAGVTLDACTATPAPAGATVIDRRIEAVIGRSLYLPVQQHTGGIDLDWMLTCLLRGSDGSVRLEPFDADWDMDVMGGIDIAVLGKTAVPGSLQPLFSGFGLAEGFPLELVVEVRDPAIPCIEAFFFQDWDPENKYVTFQFWDLPWEELGTPIWWRSDDGGETWVDYTNAPDIEWPEWPGRVTYNYDEITAPIMFCLEVPGAGVSNVVTIREIDGSPVGDNGGDRTGTDRPGGGEQPPPNDDPGGGGVIVDPVDPVVPPGDGGGQPGDGEDNNSGGNGQPGENGNGGNPGGDAGNGVDNGNSGNATPSPAGGDTPTGGTGNGGAAGGNNPTPGGGQAGAGATLQGNVDTPQTGAAPAAQAPTDGGNNTADTATPAGQQVQTEGSYPPARVPAVVFVLGGVAGLGCTGAFVWLNLRAKRGGAL